MLNIILAMLIAYGFFTILACFLNFLIQIVLKRFEISYLKVIQISNVGFGASLMVTFLAMMFIPQFNISPEEKTLYLFYVFATSYLLIVLFSFYSQLTFKEPSIENKTDLSEDEEIGNDENNR